MGIIGVIQQRGGSVLTARQKLYISALLVSSIFVISLAFVPSLLTRIPGENTNVWLYSIRTMFAGHLVTWAVTIPFHLQGRLVVASIPMVEKLVVFPIVVVGLLAVVLEGAMAYGFLGQWIPLVFEAVLIFFVLLGVACFVMILLNRESEEAPLDEKVGADT